MKEPFVDIEDVGKTERQEDGRSSPRYWYETSDFHSERESNPAISRFFYNLPRNIKVHPSSIHVSLSNSPIPKYPQMPNFITLPFRHAFTLH